MFNSSQNDVFYAKKFIPSSIMCRNDDNTLDHNRAFCTSI